MGYNSNTASDVPYDDMLVETCESSAHGMMGRTGKTGIGDG